MFDDSPTPYQALLLTCAILPWFDEDLLRSTAASASPLIAELLASDDSVPAEPSGRWRSLRAELQAAAFDWIVAHPQFDELQIHTQAFGAFLGYLQAPHQHEWRQLYERQCFHHLDKIFFLAAPRGAWQMIAQRIAEARSVEPLQVIHQHQLAFYAGSVALNTQQYDRAELIFAGLLHEVDLSAEQRVRVLNGLALTYMYQNAYDQALDLYQQVYTLAEAIADRFYQAAALSNMSMIYNDLDYYQRALELNLRSLAIFRDLQDRRREAIVLYEIGNNALRLGRWQVAEEHFNQAIDLCEKFAMHGRLGNLYWAQGLLYHFLGDELRSETAYLRALAIAQSSEHGDRRVANDILWQLGFLYITQGRSDQGLELYDQAISLARDLRRNHWLSLMQYQRGNVFERQGRLDAAFAAYAQAIDGIEALRGASENEEIKIGLLGTTQQMQIYEAMVLLCLELGRPADAFHYVERARSRAFLDTLVKKSPELYDALAQPVVTLADVQAQLPEGALLLEYFSTGVLPMGEHMLNSIPASNARLRQHLTLPPQVILFAITRDHCEIDRPALNPNSLRPPVGDRYPGRHLLHGRLPQHLYDRLIAPAAALLQGCTTLYLVPHGPLHYVPFTALRSATGAYLLHANGPALAHAPSATILLRNCIGRPSARGTATLAIGFNDPQGDQPLRYAEAEAEHVAHILGGDAWTGMLPKSERLIAAGQSIRWLHIAGHARFDPADPLGSALYLGPNDPLSARAIIHNLDLSAELVTLSSCTSGVSHVVPGDELLGLQRALLYAGVPTVLCTRWEARDLVSLLVMDHFYTALQQGQPPGLALRDAQIAVRELTGPDLAALIERWDAPDRLALAAPADVDMGALRDAWRGEAPELAAALDQPAVQPRTQAALPLADPLFWAPFMLVGRV